MEKRLERLLELSCSQKEAIHYSVVHSVLVANSLEGWMGYIAWLEKDLKDRVSVVSELPLAELTIRLLQSDRITFSNLGAGEKDFTFNVEDRQALKLTEDAVVDLEIVISTLSNVVEGIRGYLKRSCEVNCESKPRKAHICTAVLEEFDSHVSAVELVRSRVQSLKDRVASSVRLVSKK